MNRLIEHLEGLLAGPVMEAMAEVRPAFASPAGKMRMARDLASAIPAHRVYVEPFAGSAAVLHAKPKSEVEVVNDLDEDVAWALKALSTLSKAEMDALIAMDFTGDQAKYLQMFDSKPTSKVGRLFRFLYLTRFSMNSGRGRSQFNKFQTYTTPYLERRVPPAVERLKGVKVHNEDYEKVCRKYDSPDTFFFLDPPYAGFSALKGSAGEKAFDERRFFDMLQSLRGKWLLNYGDKGELPAMLRGAGYKIRTETRSSTANIQKSADAKGTKLNHIIVKNFR
jgi:DNA adenine methylase